MEMVDLIVDEICSSSVVMEMGASVQYVSGNSNKWLKWNIC